jgi:hypothetical protein
LPPPAGPADYLSTLHRESNETLARADFEGVAGRLGCEWEAVGAVAKVESGALGGFAADGRPIILFERHLFSRWTNHQYDATHPNVSNQTPGGYPRTQADRWAQMAEAYALDPEAALRPDCRFACWVYQPESRPVVAYWATRSYSCWASHAHFCCTTS